MSYDYWLSHQSIKNLLLKDRRNIIPIVGLFEVNPNKLTNHLNDYEKIYADLKIEFSEFILSTNCGIGLLQNSDADRILKLFFNLR